MQGSDRREEALDWVVRTNDPDFAAWDEFSAWLESSSDNADMYHRLIESEARLRPLLTAGPADTPVRKIMGGSRPVWLSAAAAAAVLTLVVAPRLMPVDYSTVPGEVRVVSLGGQDELVLNGGTRVRLAGFDRRDIRLGEGQILLRLNEPKGGTVEVESGDLRLVDVGTVFEVWRSRTTTRVLVSHGAVVADPGGAALRLDAGEGLETTDGARRLAATPANVESVGSFARGQLVYRGERLERVLEDIRRSTGIDFFSDQSISSHRFTGTLSVAEVKRDPRSLEPLLGLAMEPTGQGWRLRGRV